MTKIWIVYLIARKRGTNQKIVKIAGEYWSKFDAYERQEQLKKDIKKLIITRLFYKITTITTFKEI